LKLDRKIPVYDELPVPLRDMRGHGHQGKRACALGLHFRSVHQSGDHENEDG
jgi:hypothetical protein